MTPPKTQNGQSGMPKYSSEELRAAFRFVYDTIEGMVLQNHYTLLGDAAKAVRYEDYQPIPKLEVGLQTNRLTPEARQSLIEWGYTKTDRGYEQMKFNVPIIFREVKRKYRFFQHPDTRFFDVDEYKIPNPFENYWKARFIVQ